MKRANKFTALIIALSLILLGACKGSASEVDLSLYPESVQNGQYSPQFYDSAIDFIEKYKIVLDGVKVLSDSANAVPEIVKSEKYGSAALNMIDFYEENVLTIKFKAKTDEDKAMHQLITNIIAIQDKHNATLKKKIKGKATESETIETILDDALLSSMYSQLKEQIE